MRDLETPSDSGQPILRVERTHHSDPNFIGLAQRLTAFLSELNGDLDSTYAPLNRSDSMPYVVVAYLGDEAVGCGALRPFEEGQIEIKRMYVAPEARQLGAGRAILAELERWAAELGNTAAVLETSPALESAIHLYRAMGYERIPNFGKYVGMETSICMAKRLA